MPLTLEPAMVLRQRAKSPRPRRRRALPRRTRRSERCMSYWAPTMTARFLGTHGRFEFSQALLRQGYQGVDIGHHLAACDVAESDAVGVRARCNVERQPVIDR